MAIKLELIRVSKRYSTGNVAASGLSFQVQEGQFTVVLGPSGCGKTTMLRLVAGLLRPDEGQIVLDGHVIASPQKMLPPEQRQMALVFQSYALWPHMTVFDNVAYGLRLREVARPELRARVEEALELVQLPGLGGRYPSELSGGQQQRVALARALVIRPAVLLLDEPLSNLDAALREEMRFELKELQRRLRVTTLYVTHDQSEALILADRMLVMRQGQIAQEGSPEDLYLRPSSSFVATFLGGTNLIGGTVVSVDGTTATVATPSGARLIGTVPELARGALRPGDEAVVAVRPSEIRLHLDKPTGYPNQLSGMVMERVFLGDLVEYRFKNPAGLLRARAPRSSPVATGLSAWVTFPVDACTVLPMEGSERSPERWNRTTGDTEIVPSRGR